MIPGTFNTLLCTNDTILLALQYINTAAGRSSVNGTINTATPRMIFLNRPRILSVCPSIPSAAFSSTISRNVAAEMTGNAYVGSATVRSLNHSVPPSTMLGTLAAASPRSAEKKPINSGACTNTVAMLFNGLQLYFFHTAMTCCW